MNLRFKSRNQGIPFGRGTSLADNARSKNSLPQDLIAGLTTGIANIPDAMATAILAGANPVYGLYSLIIGTPVGALLGSSQFMQVCTTSVLAIATGLALNGRSEETFTQSIFLIAFLVGIFEVIAGFLRFGRLMRFVSNAVMRGFLTGISILVVLSQAGDLTGYISTYSNKVVKFIDLLFHLNQIPNPSQIQALIEQIVTNLVVNIKISARIFIVRLNCVSHISLISYQRL